MNNIMNWVEQWAQVETIRTYVGLGLLGLAAIATLIVAICAHFRDRQKRKGKKDKRK